MISTLKRALTIEAVLANAGVVVHRGKALCVFHADTRPSLSIKGEHFKCFVCGVGGDIIDFTEKFYKLSTGEAIRKLAGDAGIPLTQSASKEVRRALDERKRQERLVAEFKNWERTYRDNLACVLRTYRRTRLEAKTEDDFLTLAPLTQCMDEVEYLYFLLCAKDDSPKIEIYKRTKNL